MPGDVELFVKQELVSFKSMIEANPADGSFYIPHITLMEFTSDQVRLLNLLMWTLTKEFNDYEWSTSEELFSTGITVRWRKKR